MSAEKQIAFEQAYADVLYARIDEQIANLEKQLNQVIGEQFASTHQNRSERDSFAAFYEDRLALLRSVARHALFGRMDLTDGSTKYIGRIGVFTADSKQLLVDWRAPAAAAFYQATAKVPLGLRLRRHLVMDERTVKGIEDDVLDLELLNLETTQNHFLQGEGALLAAVSSARTGRMGDIVATIQAEQDKIIRSHTRSVLIVQGGPGTGKTAVALHRAAYQLYQNRERLEHSGVLILAPSKNFLRYIERVLPSLGESAVVMMTPGEIFPGIKTTSHDSEAVGVIKGDLKMAKVLKKALKQRQLVPKEKIELNIDGVRLELNPEDVIKARAEARSTGKPHNEARNTFVRAAIEILLDKYIVELKRSDKSYLVDERSELISNLLSNHEVKVALNTLWLPYSAQSFLKSFYASVQRLEKAGKHLFSAQQMRLLHRSKDSEWSIDDIPLLDELAELLGEIGNKAKANSSSNSKEANSNERYAQKVLDMLESDGLVSAKDLALQIGSSREIKSLAERAENDRSWTYGHIVVDEAQELSAMMWRAIMRKNPSKSFTIVGDVAQTSTSAGASAWHQALSPFIDERYRVEELSVNYRTPRRIMDLSLAYAKQVGLEVTEVQSVREGEFDPKFYPGNWALADAGSTNAMELLHQAVLEITSKVTGTAVVIANSKFHSKILARLTDFKPGFSHDALDSNLAIMSAREAKGLEFDAAIIFEPELIARSHARGPNDLYVAMTRPTQILALVGSEDSDIFKTLA